MNIVTGKNQVFKTTRLEQEVVNLIEPVVRRMNCQLWDVVWISNQRILRIYISKSSIDDPITHADCALVTRDIEDVIVEKFPELGERFHLEVSSLGTMPFIRTVDQLSLFTEQPLEFTDRLGNKFTAIVNRVEPDGRIDWRSESSKDGSEHVINHISDFKKIRVKHARY